MHMHTWLSGSLGTYLLPLVTEVLRPVPRTPGAFSLHSGHPPLAAPTGWASRPEASVPHKPRSCAPVTGCLPIQMCYLSYKVSGALDRVAGKHLGQVLDTLSCPWDLKDE